MLHFYKIIFIKTWLAKKCDILGKLYMVNKFNNLKIFYLKNLSMKKKLLKKTIIL